MGNYEIDLQKRKIEYARSKVSYWIDVVGDTATQERGFNLSYEGAIRMKEDMDIIREVISESALDGLKVNEIELNGELPEKGEIGTIYHCHNKEWIWYDGRWELIG